MSINPQDLFLSLFPQTQTYGQEVKIQVSAPIWMQGIPFRVFKDHIQVFSGTFKGATPNTFSYYPDVIGQFQFYAASFPDPLGQVHISETETLFVNPALAYPQPWTFTVQQWTIDDVQRRFGSTPADTDPVFGYNPYYDVDQDQKIDIIDVATFAANFGLEVTLPFPLPPPDGDGDGNGGDGGTAQNTILIAVIVGIVIFAVLLAFGGKKK
jgi:hypothetical protein